MFIIPSNNNTLFQFVCLQHNFKYRIYENNSSNEHQKPKISYHPSDISSYSKNALLFFFLTAKKDIKEVEADSEVGTPSTQSSEDTATDTAPSSQLVAEPAPPQRDSHEKAKESVNNLMSKQQSAELNPSVLQIPAKCTPSPAEQSPSNSAPRHHETGALMVTKTTYVIPKKQAGPQTQSSSHISASASCQKPSSASTLLNETRNLPVPPAPSAPSSRPSQPNNQVRQSIQRSLTSILLKR